MDDAKQLWSLWQTLLASFKPQFTYGGWVRFVQWVTGMVLCHEEHTITQILTSEGLESRWRVLEHFAEYGAWNHAEVERQLFRLVEPRCDTWGRYRVVCVDDTKEHRYSRNVWGVCTFHEYSARSPNRATTVRAHNWVVMGALAPGQPWTYLPQAARLYCRRTQLPEGQVFRTKTALAVEMLQAAAATASAPLIAAFDGAYALKTVVKQLLQPPPTQPRVELVSKLRKDARLYEPLRAAPPNPKGGRPRRWGRRLPAPQHHEQWPTPWKKGAAYIYGRQRSFRAKRLECRWAVSGPTEPVVAYVFEVEGYAEPWFTITSAVDLTAAEVVALKAGRFRQEDGFRDQKQRLGMEECRAWTKAPILRTFQVQIVAQALLRLLAARLDETRGPQSWWSIPEWNRRKTHPSILDLRRLFWRHRLRFSQLLLALEELQKPPQAKYQAAGAKARAA